MRRTYTRHGLITLQRRRLARRNGPLNRKHRSGKNAEMLRSEMVADKGGLERISALMLDSINLYTTERAILDEIDAGIYAFFKDRPEILRKPAAVAKIVAYRDATVNRLIKLQQIIGFERIQKEADLEDCFPDEDTDTDQNGGNEVK
jgi:hypothetical protein